MSTPKKKKKTPRKAASNPSKLNKSRQAFGKLLKDVEKRPTLRKALVQSRSATLKKYGIAPQDYEQVRSAFSTLSKFNVSVTPDFSWPAETDDSIEVDSISPSSFPANTKTFVTILGSNFPADSSFGLYLRTERIKIFGDIESQSDTEITGWLTVGTADTYELRVGTHDNNGALEGVDVGDDA